jgi:hypothetical protein
MTEQPYDRNANRDTDVESGEGFSPSPTSGDIEGYERPVETESSDDTGGRGDPTP